ncbi:MAG: hypothetical protein BTN85_1759 [Candidatus Methanohalarchaeum thermophilum]|uniref:Uncharacterized protein n=1 Tax=Methanohalarchaeum thermophilum TaxID=1903181 RepID=A0A1Q6DRW6_METT1|nr:MAG: hypothetical protein BTN85_1759 [Candidatus Methanohalarchaeum thermophilum]
MPDRLESKDKENETLNEKIFESLVKIGVKPQKASKMSIEIENQIENGEDLSSNEIRKEVIKYLNQEGLYPKQRSTNYNSLIKQTEEFLKKETPSFGTSEILYIELDNLIDFNKLRRKVKEKDNLKIMEVERKDEGIFVELEVFSPSQSLL